MSCYLKCIEICDSLSLNFPVVLSLASSWLRLYNLSLVLLPHPPLVMMLVPMGSLITSNLTKQVKLGHLCSVTIISACSDSSRTLVF